MWLFDRRLILAGALALAGCGLTPVYGPNGAGSALRGNLTLDPPTDRLDFEFVKAVDRQLGRGENGALRLTYDIAVQEEGTVVSAAQEINRLSLVGTVTYSVSKDVSDAVLTGSVRNFTNYSATGSTLATDSAKRDAEDRLMVILADQMIAQLLLDLPR